jgi:hypothetical protein
MDWSFRNNWDENAWCREIRKDELRIAGYFRALIGCLDLPGEDDMIFKRLMSQPELVPTGVTDPYRTLKNEMEAWEEENELDDEARENRRAHTMDVSRRVRKLAIEWNLLAAADWGKYSAGELLKITCAFGKLLSRLYNLEETDIEPETLNLRISLLKYSLADLNTLVESIIDFQNNSNNNILPERFVEPLAFVRENLLDRMRELRNS